MPRQVEILRTATCALSAAPRPVSAALPPPLACLDQHRLGSRPQLHAMWELVATAVAGLNAGAGLQAALAGSGAGANDAIAFSKFASRSRMLGLFLSTVSTSACVMAYTGGGRTAWEAVGVGSRQHSGAGSVRHSRPLLSERRRPSAAAATRRLRQSGCTLAPCSRPSSASESRGALWLAAAAGVGEGAWWASRRGCIKHLFLACACRAP